MKRRRSSSLNRRARRRPTRLAGNSPASAHRRNDASLARRNRAASRVVSNLSLNALYMTVMMSKSSECHTRSHILQTYARVPRRSRTDGLTAREVEILRRVTSGLTNRQLAQELGVSTRTIDAHLRSVYAKLGVKSRSAATRYAIEHDLV